MVRSVDCLFNGAIESPLSNIILIFKGSESPLTILVDDKSFFSNESFFTGMGNVFDSDDNDKF
ncbi:hypothetical protein DERP_005525 [Dermatophagoides pteronyssinus]|uniref:Uncharacterized protein n=1 Tax=Dermatophagoides pteronyssinus TaxID=6956 RepID=A0ABQ8JNL2_DERPT|nr:hypothetical protein DERP_005525 [Dermatophagoides pteronyssinus]